jgi:hypothetical protein
MGACAVASSRIMSAPFSAMDRVKSIGYVNSQAPNHVGNYIVGARLLQHFASRQPCAHAFRRVELVNAGLATATAERIAGKLKMEVARVRITKAGRRSLVARGAQDGK